MSSFLDTLNPVQRKAVTTTEGPVMVIAGPGSGKTRVLTSRIAHIIEKGNAPYEILALTFTNKAAREMTERIGKVVGNKSKQLWAGTFHSIFAKILRFEADKIGYPNSFTIYDSDDSKSLISDIIREMSLDPKTYSPQAIRSRISSAKSNLITPKLYTQNEEIMLQDQTNRRPYTHMIYERYMKRCQKAGAMDFDDLLLQLFRLFQENSDQVLEKYQRKFKYIMVDEFQDTNFLQYAILKQLKKYPGSNENLGIVGDDAQSIYAFRGATIDNILNFEKDFPSAKVFKLEQNYRSVNAIVQAANEVISYNKKQIQKKIWTDKSDVSKIRLVRTLSDTEEGRRVADSIVEHKTRHHIPNKEIAILYRTNAQSRIFEEQLRRMNIPYKIVGGTSFYQRKEIKDLLAYMRLSVNRVDDEAFKRILNFPKRGIGQSTLQSIQSYALQNDLSYFDAAQQTPLKTAARKKVNQFISMIQHFGEKAKKLNAFDAVVEIFKNSGIHSHYSADTSVEGKGRMENLSSLLDGVQEFIENDEIIDGQIVDDKSLDAYLQTIALLTDQDIDKKGDDFVTLMSVHSAKGLEFESVFIVGMEENLFPSFMALQGKEDVDEERRLFYVAITRAKRFLNISFSQSRYQYGQMRRNEPSRFLDEISDDWLESPKAKYSDTLGAELSANEPKLAKVSGVRKKPQGVVAQSVKHIDPTSFKPSPTSQITEGQKVRHLKFGEGIVKKIDGSNDKKVATIYFKEIENPERRIMLKFSKLEIVS